MIQSIGSVLAAFIFFLSRKIGVAASAIATAVLLTAAMVACINSILTSVLALLALPTWVSVAVGMFIPTNFGAVLAAIMSSYICRAAYDLAMTKIKMVSSAS